MKYLIGVVLIMAVVGCTDTTGPDVQQQPSTTVMQPSTTVLPAFTNLSFAQISGGLAHSCGRTLTGGRLYCWGANEYGELGNASLNNKKRPTPVSSTLQFRWVSAGPGHTCAIATDAKAYCWGGNWTGQLGDGTTTDRWSPTLVNGGLSWKQIEVGGTSVAGAFTCGITTSDMIYCWGDNGYGQLGNGLSIEFRTSPTATIDIGVSYRQLTTGGGHTCALSMANLAYCWGNSRYGQTGNGGTFYQPTAVSRGLAFRQVSAGENHTCGTTTANKAYCWGRGRYGVLGTETTTNRPAPHAVSGSLSYSRVFASAYHTCGLTTGQKAYCWGENFSGQLGDGTTTSRITPVAVQTGVRFVQLGLGETYTCAVQADTGVGYCWGDNHFGQLGDGTTSTTSPRLTPTRVAGAL